MKEIKYALRGVTIDQFATVFEPASDNVEINISIPIKTNYGGRALAVGANIQFTEAGRPFMVAEAFCHYEIEEACGMIYLMAARQVSLFQNNSWTHLLELL